MIYRRREGEVVRRNRIGWMHDPWTHIGFVWKFGRVVGYFRWRNHNPDKVPTFIWSWDVMKKDAEIAPRATARGSYGDK